MRSKTKILKIIYIYNNTRTLKLGWCNERDKYPVESESAKTTSFAALINRRTGYAFKTRFRWRGYRKVLDCRVDISDTKRSKTTSYFHSFYCLFH